MKQKIRRCRVTLYDFINGIWSGIPICCNIKFCKMSYKGIKKIAYVLHKEREPDVPFESRANGPRYVRCDKCYHDNRRVEIKQNGVILKRLLGTGPR